MFAWLHLLKYLEYRQNINLMTSTLMKASENIFMFLLGVIPFFFGKFKINLLIGFVFLA